MANSVKAKPAPKGRQSKKVAKPSMLKRLFRINSDGTVNVTGEGFDER